MTKRDDYQLKRKPGRPSSGATMVPISSWVDVKVRARLHACAAGQQRTVTDVLGRALLQYLDRLGY